MCMIVTTNQTVILHQRSQPSCCWCKIKYSLEANENVMQMNEINNVWVVGWAGRWVGG